MSWASSSAWDRTTTRRSRTSSAGGRPVSAIVLDPKNPHQRAVAEVAAGIGLDVFLDPATERLTRPGFQLPGKLDRLRRAVEVRTLINDRYKLPGVPRFKTRTLSSLIAGIEVERSARTA